MKMNQSLIHEMFSKIEKYSKNTFKILNLYNPNGLVHLKYQLFS